MRIGPGPVFVYEGMLAARRWQTYAVRAVVVAAILIGLWLTWQSLTRNMAADRVVKIRELATFGDSIYTTIAMIELTMVLLIAPATTAGAVCLDRSRGTLAHMMTTDLSSAEIVLGKLGVRLIPVLGLIAATTPVLFLASLLGGIEPLKIVGLLLVSIGCAVVGCSTAMVLSVHGRKTQDVLMLAYLLLVLWLMVPILVIIGCVLVTGRSIGQNPTGMQIYLHTESINPYAIILDRWPQGGSSIEAGLVFLAGCLAISAAMIAAAMFRIRRVVASGPDVEKPERSRAARWRLHIPGPSLDANPIAWREWHRSRPSRMMRWVWALYSILGLAWMIAIAGSPKWNGPSGVVPVLSMMFQVIVGQLLLSLGASTSLAEERASGSLDLLLTTTISTREILWGKWWGSFRRVGIVAFWPMAMAAIPAAWNFAPFAWLVLLGLLLSYGAAITSLGLAAATWIERPGRAVAACVAVYGLMLIGWPIVVFLIVNTGPDRNQHLIGQLLAGDPAYGAAMITEIITDPNIGFPGQTTAVDLELAAIFWTAAGILASVLINAWTFHTFDRKLGRMPESGTTPPRPMRGRSAASGLTEVSKAPASIAVASERRAVAGEREPDHVDGDGVAGAIVAEVVLGLPGRVHDRRVRPDADLEGE